MGEQGAKGEKGGKAGQATVVEVTLSNARGIKNTKIFGKMSPCAVVSVPNTNLTQVSNAATNGGANPAWHQTIFLEIPEDILQARDPAPAVRVEIFDSTDLSKSLGVTMLPLAGAIAHYDEAQHCTLGVFRKNKVQGYLTYSVKCARPSFAPAKGTPEYDNFVRSRAPPGPVALAKPAVGPYAAGAAAAAGPSRPHAPYPAPGHAPATGYPAAYPPPGYPAHPAPGYAAPAGAPQYAYPPQPGYPPPPGYPQYAGYPQQGYPPQGYPPQYAYPPPYGPQRVVVVEERSRGSGGMGGMGGMGMGLMAGAAGGLLLGAALDF